ncbi:MAG: hypothetical protein HC877_18750 [Thioploca sp.]|nr:hypothetical protein [Thioploca sp.]
MIIHYGRKNRSVLDLLWFPLILIFCCNLFWLPSIWAATDCTAVAGISQAECEALVNFYNNTDGPNWSDSATNNWNVTNTPCSDWAGVVCDGGYVTKIDRNQKNLTNSIPDLSALIQLQELNLCCNELTDSIPNLSALINLKVIDLSGNQLTGSIPDLSTLINLQALDLYMNQLTGSIPNLSTLTNLQLLRLFGNQLTGSIPDLSALTDLQGLHLYYNQLTGSIPDLSMLTNLQGLILSGNHLTGSIPDWLNMLTNLQILGLNYNRLTGSIPNLNALTNLQGLWLSYNQLTGSIPISLTNLNILNELDLSYNQLTAQDPTLLTFLSSKDSDWDQTQTIPPTNLQATPLSENSIEVSWTPILYSGDGGYYRVKYATTTGGPYIPTTTTTADDKSATSYVVTDLSPNTTYYFVVETYTPAHDMQQNDLTSALSTEVSATTHQSSTTPPITPPTPSLPSTPPATLLPSTMNLTIGFSGNGHGRVTTNPSGIDCDTSPNPTQCSHSFDTATWIRLIPTAAADSKFTGWSGWQSDCDDGEVFMSGLRSCTANFQLLRFPLTVTTVGQGNISSEPVGINCGDKCQHVFDIGTKVTLTAVPEKDWQFKEWSGDCDENGHTMIDSEKWCEVVLYKKR